MGTRYSVSLSYDTGCELDVASRHVNEVEEKVQSHRDQP